MKLIRRQNARMRITKIEKKGSDEMPVTQISKFLWAAIYMAVDSSNVNVFTHV